MAPLHLNEKMLLVTSDFDYRYPLSIPLHLNLQNIDDITLVHQQNGQPSSGTLLPIPSSLTGMEILTFHSIVCHVLHSFFPFSPPPFPTSHCSPCFPILTGISLVVIDQPSTKITKDFLNSGNLPAAQNSTLVTVYTPGMVRGPIPDPYLVPTGAIAGDVNSGAVIEIPFKRNRFAGVEALA
jgi:hypothetical protein